MNIIIYILIYTQAGGIHMFFVYPDHWGNDLNLT